MTYNISRSLSGSSLSTWFGGASAHTEITQTYYDTPLSCTSTYFGTGGQQNLRGRVASTIFWSAPSSYPTSGCAYDNGIHYSYDIHGDVQTQIRENNNFNLASVGLGSLKRVDYNYDLVSGNVNNEYYQKGLPDEFDHKYEYDADNRLTVAYSSRNGVVWEKEAKEFYYPHGPKARAEIGDKEVQGMDYAYTIQGWIKGMNSTTLASTRDMGYDGESTIPVSGANNLDYTFGKDVYGYGLDYFSGDYSPIKGVTSGYSFQPTTNTSSSLFGATYDLFNGNISRMVTALTDNTMTQMPVMARAFRYDQLERIKKANAFTDANVISTDNFNATSDNGTFYEDFSFDDNGNLNAVNRNGNNTGGTQAMDNFIYNYWTKLGSQAAIGTSLGSGDEFTNKLAYVSDNPANTIHYLNDIDNQSSSNYIYDESGQLIHDYQEGIDSIKWTVYGKVAKVIRASTSSSSDLEFIYDASGNRIVKIEKPRTCSGSCTQLNWIYTYYERDAKGNILAVYKRTFSSSGGSNYVDHYKLVEHDIYGSSRLGIRDGNSGDDYTTPFTATLGSGSGAMFTSVSYGTGYIWGTPTNFTRTLGYKEYEASNHLGNVQETFSDKRIPTCVGGGSTVAYYQPAVISATDYYAFGAQMPGRVFVSGASQYGFNGKRSDPETYNTLGAEYDYGMRIYSSRLGKFLSVDPLTKKFAFYSPYHFAGNTPIWASDLDGKEPWFNNTTSTFMFGPFSLDYIKANNMEPAMAIQLPTASMVFVKAEEINASLGYSEPPFTPGTLVKEFPAYGENGFVRVWSSDAPDSKMTGSWLIKASELHDMTPSELQDKFSLPFEPDQMARVDVPNGTIMQQGNANAAFTNDKTGLPNKGGGMQYRLTERIPDSYFTPIGPLPTQAIIDNQRLRNWSETGNIHDDSWKSRTEEDIEPIEGKPVEQKVEPMNEQKIEPITPE
jgi:RHS repeat-associated protein